MVERIGGRRIGKGPVFFVGGRVGGPEAGVSRVLEGAAGIVVLIMELVKMGCWEMTSLRTADGDGMNRGNVVSELTILVGVCAKTLWGIWGLESVNRFTLEGWVWVEGGGKGGEELLGSKRVSGVKADGLPLRSVGGRSDDSWGTSVSSGARTR